MGAEKGDGAAPPTFSILSQRLTGSLGVVARQCREFAVGWPLKKRLGLSTKSVSIVFSDPLRSGRNVTIHSEAHDTGEFYASAGITSSVSRRNEAWLSGAASR